MLEIMRRGGPIMYPLAACSFVAVMFIIERIIFWTRYVRSRDNPVLERVLGLAEEARYEEAADGAAEIVAALEPDAPELGVHLAFHAWLLRRAGRLDEARAIESRLAEDPPPPREPEREEQAADNTRPR